MWRAFFLGLGITCVIFGAGCTVVDKVVLAVKGTPPPAAATGVPAEPAAPRRTREVKIPEWAPWSLMAGGAVVILYSFSIPRRVGGD
jgi:hypothetical protein